MDEFKSRIIRISNIPSDQIIYEVKSKPIASFCVMGLIGVFQLFSRFWMFGLFFVFISLYALFCFPNRTLMIITERFLVSFEAENKQECIIIYWNEVEKWTYIMTRQPTDLIYLELNDRDRMNLPVRYPRKVISYFYKYAQGKGVKTRETSRFFKR